ncbi:hypothetical protein Bca4012_038761 [Brassica carinata]
MEAASEVSNLMEKVMHPDVHVLPSLVVCIYDMGFTGCCVKSDGFGGKPGFCRLLTIAMRVSVFALAEENEQRELEQNLYNGKASHKQRHTSKAEQPQLRVRTPKYGVQAVPKISNTLIPNNLQKDVHSCKSTDEALKLALLQSPSVSTNFPSFVNHGQALKTVEIVPDIRLPLKIVEELSCRMWNKFLGEDFSMKVLIRTVRINLSKQPLKDMSPDNTVVIVLNTANY